MSDPTRHAPDPRDEVRECFHCGGVDNHDCPDCEGRGYVVGHFDGIGIVRARSQDVIEVWQWDEPQDGEELWVWRCRGRSGEDIVGGYPTADEALLAARCAYLGIEIFHDLKHEWCWRWRSEKSECGCDGFTSSTAALCAAIDAKEE